MDDAGIPAVLRTLITTSIAYELAQTYTDQVVYPETLLIDNPEDVPRLFPDWPTPVLVIARENQGVCSWGVPLGDPRPPVLVGGELAGDLAGTRGTVVYTCDVAGYIAARRWDHRCLNREPLLQAQADPLDDKSLAHLRASFDERPATRGWPGNAQFRFERRGVNLLLWSGPDQCDWWLSATHDAALRAAAAQLIELSDLLTSMWACDAAGVELLDEIRGHAPGRGQPLA